MPGREAAQLVKERWLNGWWNQCSPRLQYATTEGYVAGETPVAFPGSFSGNSLFGSPKTSLPPKGLPADSVNSGLGIYGTGLGYPMAVTSQAGIQRYFTYILNCPINLVADNDTTTELLASSDMKAMPSFSQTGCIQQRGDIVVVKLSD